MTKLLVDINSFSVEELKEMVMAYQQRVLIEMRKQELTDVKIKSLQTENEALRNLLSQRIIDIIVAPQVIQSVPQEGGDAGEEETEAAPVKIDDSDKDKFQA